MILPDLRVVNDLVLWVKGQTERSVKTFYRGHEFTGLIEVQGNAVDDALATVSVQQELGGIRS